MRKAADLRPCCRGVAPFVFAALVTVAAAAALAATACGSEGAASAPGPSISSAPGVVDARMPGDEVLATIDGSPVTMAEVTERVGSRLADMDFRYRSDRHQLVESTARQLVRDRLIEDEAAARGITVEALVTSAVADRAEVTDEEVDTFYRQNEAQLHSQLAGMPIEQMRQQIRAYLANQKRQGALEEFAAELAADRHVDYILGPFRVEIDVAAAPVKGPAAAAVTLVEFSDFECPFCRQFYTTLKEVESNYGDRVRIAYMQFPLDIHPNAAKAAEASLCANDQGKFWEAHDLYFVEQDSLSVSDLKEKADRLDLDAAAFAACLDSGKHTEQVEAETRLGMSVGVTGTPALFVNGRPLPGGAVPYEMVAEIIDAELARAGR